MVTRIHKAPSKLTYLLNDYYNLWWLKRTKMPHFQSVSVAEFKTASKNKSSAQPFMITWLRNLDRLVHLSSPFDPLRFHFMDIGCGTGIVCMYAASKYKFQSVSGLDFEANFIQKAGENLTAFQGEIRTANINFVEADAATFDLTSQRYFIFLFNPFGADVLTSFLDRNLKVLIENKSVIAYANDRYVEIFNGYPCVVRRNSKYNISVISF